jgi:hypothetical protein
MRVLKFMHVSHGDTYLGLKHVSNVKQDPISLGQNPIRRTKDKKTIKHNGI